MIAVTIINSIPIGLEITSYSVAFRFPLVRSECTHGSLEIVITKKRAIFLAVSLRMT